MAKEIQSFEVFWPFYLGEHSNPTNRALHAVGTAGGGLTALAALLTSQPLLLPLALVCGYGFAWFGHFRIEENKPASFSYPAWSFLGDLKMCALFFTGRLGAEMARHGLESRAGK